MISKHNFFNIWKGDKQKFGPSFLRFVSIPFSNIWKKYKQKIWPGFVKFVGILF